MQHLQVHATALQQVLLAQEGVVLADHHLLDAVQQDGAAAHGAG
ncbi:hypothetical protein NWF32_28580 [Pseudomonas qingdaonensis]|nr:hypothetical protein [Pseudomonas qingdaonensis]